MWYQAVVVGQLSECCGDVLCAANVHNMLCCDDNLSLKETFVTSSTCQHLVTLLQSLAVSLLLVICNASVHVSKSCVIAYFCITVTVTATKRLLYT